MSTVAIILAYDAGEGFDGPKYASVLAGKPLVSGVIDDALSWPVDEIVVVLGHDASGVIETIGPVLDHDKVSIVVDEGWSEGEASPLRAALDLVSRDRSVQTCVLARGDQPGVRAHDVSALVEALEADQVMAAIPKYRYASGWPIVLSQRAWDLFLGLEGGIDVRDILASHGAAITEVWIDHLEPRRYRNASDFDRF
jgi:CTP:molybdopterin cytidylyltransferase MocA